MKKLFSAFLLSTMISCGPSVEDAVNYNDQMIHEQFKVVHAIDSLDQMILNKDTALVESYFKEVIEKINKELIIVDSIGDFENNSDYKTNLKQLFESYKNIVSNEYRQLINVCLMPDSLYSKDTLSYFNNILKQVNEKISNQINVFNNFQEDFAKKHNFELVDKK